MLAHPHPTAPDQHDGQYEPDRDEPEHGNVCHSASEPTVPARSAGGLSLVARSLVSLHSEETSGLRVILHGVEEAKRRGLAAVYVADIGRGLLQIGNRQFHRDVIRVEILWDEAPPPGVRLRVTLAAGDGEPGPGGTTPRRRGQTRPTGREAYGPASVTNSSVGNV